ncbi:2OG-Fe dioxygenase family protein [Streptomyces sp. NBC_00572]|uniref:2OG-Fe dioxygenase family protein n=1 Tax=Streptomyces sp. NBC_00572 TaxID=2903664 RepID=UPI00338E248C
MTITLGAGRSRSFSIPDRSVDAHLIRVTARAGAHGNPSPAGRHRDGFDCMAYLDCGFHLGRRRPPLRGPS